jgi:hypothetical protein
MAPQFTPEFGRATLTGTAWHFRAIPAQTPIWLSHIDRWIAYANSVIEE